MKTFTQFVNESEGFDRVKRLIRLREIGMVDRVINGGLSPEDLQAIVTSVFNELKAAHSAQPEVWGEPSIRLNPQMSVIHVNLAVRALPNLPAFHYNNWSYRLNADWANLTIFYTQANCIIVIEANYTDDEAIDSDDPQEVENNSYDGTWEHVCGAQDEVLSLADLQLAIDGFNQEEDLNTASGKYSESWPWR